jgi:cell division protein FtsN
MLSPVRKVFLLRRYKMAAKKPTPASKTPSKAAPKPSTPARSAAPVSTPVRNTAVPKAAPAPKPVVITYEMIAKRAFEIHCGGTGGSEQDNWYRAERELRAGK